MSVTKPLLPLDKLKTFCKKHHIAKLALYGSMLSDEFQTSSDVDLLAFFDKAHIPSLFELSALEEELSCLIGHKVDLRTPGDLSPFFKEDVFKKMRVLYEI